MERLLRLIQRRAFDRGKRGQGTAWLVVGAAAWVLVRARRSDEVVYRTKLHPGERLVIRADRPGSAPSPDL